MMNRFRRSLMCHAAVLAALLPAAARADFEATGPDGRKILLRDDRTWKYLDAGAAQVKAAEIGEAVLTLERKIEEGPNCRFELRLTNDLPYEIRNIVPSFSAYRADGVRYETTSVGFFSIRNGNSLMRSILFQGITCPEIARVLVSGGDRCEMGDLDKFSPETGVCLARIRVAPSDLVRFEK